MAKDLTYNNISTDSTFTANSDLLIPSQKTIKTALASATAGLEPTVTKGRLIGVSPLTCSNNSGSVIGSNVTVSIEALGRMIGVSPLTCSNNSGSVFNGNVTVSIEALGRVIGSDNQITCSNNSGSVLNSNVTLSLVDDIVVNSVTATTSIRIVTSRTITNSTDSGTVGTIAWDADNIYICVATDTWKKASIATW